MFDHTLSWSHQVSKVCQSMSYYFYLCVKQTETNDLLKLFSGSLVFSHVLYCLPVRGPSLSDANINCLKLLQYRAIHLCMGLRKYDHYISSLFSRL